MPSIYDNTPDEGIIDDILNFEDEVEQATKKLKLAKAALLDRKQTEIASALSQKPEPFGAVSQQIANQKVTFTTPKKVEWDQEGLKQLQDQMIKDGADPAEYITVELKVKEDAYKNWPSNLKEYFEPHRTVTPGNVAVKVEPIKEK